MNWKPVQYTDHAVKEMRKARITRQLIRTVLARGTRRIEGERGGEVYFAKTAEVRGRKVEVIYVANAERVLIITAYRVGEYD
jgi:hypothetical protein